MPFYFHERKAKFAQLSLFVYSKRRTAEPRRAVTERPGRPRNCAALVRSKGRSRATPGPRALRGAFKPAARAEDAPVCPGGGAFGRGALPRPLTAPHPAPESLRPRRAARTRLTSPGRRSPPRLPLLPWPRDRRRRDRYSRPDELQPRRPALPPAPHPCSPKGGNAQTHL